MAFTTSVSVTTFSKETAHRATIHLTDETGLFVFAVPEGVGSFEHLKEVVGFTRHRNAWTLAFERCDTQPIGSIELDDDDLAKLAGYRVAM
jgi:hypothetical protein